MKRKLLAIVCMSILTVACQKSKQETTPGPRNSATDQNIGSQQDISNNVNADRRYVGNLGTMAQCTAGTGSEFISIVEANAMIGSYLFSIHCDSNDNDVKSYSVDANMLREYLSHQEVKNLKLIFAHTTNYMKAGNIGRHAGYKSGALTIIIAGYDDKGDYVYHNGMVLDHLNPCPSTCPPGMAGSSFLY